MLFNSYEFILLFLPLALAGFYLMASVGGKSLAAIWLVTASLFFYGWWRPSYLLLLLLSIAVNYAIGEMIARKEGKNRRGWLILGIVFNLSLLGYFKYSFFFATTFGQLTGADITFPAIALPLAISFFTFQQIAYLFDLYRNEAPKTSLINYALFVSFFPQLIAGPIVHHKEMLPQFEKLKPGKIDWTLIASGLTLFAIGLFKKVIIADPLGQIATPIFDRAADGQSVIAIHEAWAGALAYSFQLYFDFSGYSDMALGLGRLFGIKLPVNFDSPYKATSIIDFWRRWHITLSRFFRDYLYIPLGGNRKGVPRSMVNFVATMGLGGLWHGAGWTFILWGLLHGLYLAVNHGFRLLKVALPSPLSWGITFFFVTLSWVLFRADSLPAASVIYAGMIDIGTMGKASRLVDGLDWLRIALCFPLVLALPNAVQWIEAGEKGEPGVYAFRPRFASLAFATGLFMVALFSLTEVSEFLYFNF